MEVHDSSRPTIDKSTIKAYSGALVVGHLEKYEMIFFSEEGR